ncbi:MAG: hypothetical protein ACLPWF_15135 [Bryobacteraceae bacterium]
MKRFFGFALLLALLSIPAFAKNTQSITLDNSVKVGSTQLPAGDYKITWTGTAPNVQVTIAAKGKASVTVPAKLVDAKNGHVALQTNTVNGVQILQGIQLDNVSLMLTGATASGE